MFFTKIDKAPVEGEDFYYEEVDGIRFKVFTEKWLSKRGFCCMNFCRHCPYGFTEKNKKKKPTKKS